VRKGHGAGPGLRRHAPAGPWARWRRAGYVGCNPRWFLEDPRPAFRGRPRWSSPAGAPQSSRCGLGACDGDAPARLRNLCVDCRSGTQRQMRSLGAARSVMEAALP